VLGKSFYPLLAKESYRFVANVIGAVMLIAVALGVVIGVQIGPEFISRGLGSKLGILCALTMTRELIPIVGSMMVATQYGTGIASEIANMKVTEQVDAIKVLGINPLYYLALPRLITIALLNPLILWIASVVGVLSTYITVWIRDGLSFHSYIGSIESYFKISDILLCLFKASVFGILIVIIAVYFGMNTSGGAREVGKATTQTVIVSFATIVVVDYFITFIYL
jgi:phospholipid/cholesterol/gamma-HCH transport system permease protein